MSDGETEAQFLLLGSASLDIAHAGSEILAGRIALLELDPIDALEAALIDQPGDAADRLWMRGGFPDSLLTHKTIADHLDLFVDLRVVRRLAPWHANVGKRLIKAPKIYILDSGMAHALLGCVGTSARAASRVRRPPSAASTPPRRRPGSPSACVRSPV